MKFLHTSDWHIGRKLHNQSRFDEMKKFLDWLLATIQEREVDVLLVSGDIFDNTTPSASAQKMYYDFLKRARDIGCQIVVIGGNHDSAALLDAPSQLCKSLNIHVIGRAWRDNPAREVIVLPDFKAGGVDHSGLIVCAVPFLRNSDVRNDLGETDTRERQEALLAGIREHYKAVLEIARQRQAEIRLKENITVPIVVMGHLFARGGKIVEGDGVRELYVGNLNPCELDMFPSDICYTALGHIHMPQLVRSAGPDGLGTIRYSGTPIPMGFNEADQQKSVCVVTCPRDMASAMDKTRTFDLNASVTEPVVKVELVSVPTFQRLFSVHGDWDEIKTQLDEVTPDTMTTNADGEKIWLSVTYTGSDATLNIVEKVENYIREAQDTSFDLLMVRNDAKIRAVETRFGAVDDAGLDSLTPEQVFERYLLEHGLGTDCDDQEKREGLIATYKEALTEVCTGTEQEE